MISYIEIAKRLKKSKDNQDDENVITTPTKCAEDGVPPFNESAYCFRETSQYNAKKQRLSRILVFVKRYVSTQDKCIIIPISTHNFQNLNLWRRVSSVSDAIDDMIDIGILRVEDPTYRYNSPDGKNKCKTYRFYKDNAEKYIQFCNTHHVSPHSAIAWNDTHLEMIDELIFDKTSVVFSSYKKHKKPSNYSKRRFERFLTACLYENYPQLAYYQNITKEINETYYSKDGDSPLRIKFEPHFTWSKDGKSINKVGIRASCSLNNKSKKDRPMLREKYGLDKEKDVKSSVPRVTLSLTNGEWYSDKVDLYAEIYKHCGQTDKFTEPMRNAIKDLFMRAYFDKSEGEMVRHIWYAIDREGILKKDVDEQMIKLKNAIFQTCGEKPQGSEIFLAESCVYLDVFQRLLAQGRKGWLLYDAFYCSGLEGESDEEFDEIVERYLKESFDDYLFVCGKKEYIF